MTLHEEQEKIQSAMKTALSGLQEDPWLTQRVLANAKGEEPVKKKLSATMVLVIVLVTITTAALAVAAGKYFGWFDFYSEFYGVEVPEVAQQVMKDSGERQFTLGPVTPRTIVSESTARAATRTQTRWACRGKRPGRRRQSSWTDACTSWTRCWRCRRNCMGASPCSGR